MSSQDGNPLSDASTTRPVLTPPSEVSHKSSDGAGSGTKKRKRDGNTVEDLLKDPFVVKPYPSTTFVKPRTLQPLLLLPRSHLPLSSLDITPSPNGLPQSRLFETRVKILELEERMGSQHMVLIARLDEGKSLYAVERETRGLYVLLRLGSWVDLQQLRAAALVSKQDLPRASERLRVPGAIPQAAPVMTPESSQYSKKKRLAIEAIQSMVKRPSVNLSTEATPTEALPTHTSLEASMVSQSSEKLDSSLSIGDATQPTAGEIFENVRNQYFEALYLSKASLAYFAKGPLSRARAAFHLDYDSTLDMREHITFLESMIMSATVVDKKYRDGVPGCVKSIDIVDHSADDTKQDAETRKRRTSRKLKPGKNGLYPLEDILIRRWWAGYDDEEESEAPGTSREDIAKNRIAQLRIRETQLQMIIILEVLALQPLAVVSEDIGGNLPTTLPPNIGGGGKDKAARSKTPDHLSLLIDVHIDRLCIWQSIALEAVKAPMDGGSSQSEKSRGSATSPIHADNMLRDFCVEVIVPFFAARLPDRCAAISLKLGGPVVASPPRPKLSKASLSNVPSRPGAATKRPVPAKRPRNLQRVLSDERERRSLSRGPGRPISLMRSATAPVVPGLKREASEAPSLGSIPATEAPPLHANRGGLLNSKRFTQREVDMSSLAPKVNARKRTQVNIEAELKEAISALKKPNRELAGKVLAEIAEKRSASVTHSRKFKKPVQNPFSHGVQISATPRANRQKDMLSERQGQINPKIAEDVFSNATLPSSVPRIPQSVSRPRPEEQTRNSLYSIQATPTRKPVFNFVQQGNGFVDVVAAEHGSGQLLSPVQLVRSSGKLFSLAPASVINGPPSSWSSQGIQETPLKKKSEAMQAHSHPGLSTPGCGKENVGSRGDISAELNQGHKEANEDSIYKSLGWDDTDDIDGLA